MHGSTGYCTPDDSYTRMGKVRAFYKFQLHKYSSKNTHKGTFPGVAPVSIQNLYRNVIGDANNILQVIAPIFAFKKMTV